MHNSNECQESLSQHTPEEHLLICCSQHPAQHIDYIFQREGEILQLGCFECVKSGALFFNSNHFLNEVEKFLQRQSGVKKRRASSAEHYHEITSLLQLLKKSQENQLSRKFSGWVSQELRLLVKLIQFFEINEETYDLAAVKHSGGNCSLPLKKKKKKMIRKNDMDDSFSQDRSVCSENYEDHQIHQQDEDSNNLSSSSILNTLGILREDQDDDDDYQHDNEIEDDIDLELIGECMGVKQQFMLMIKELRRNAISNALYLCQHPHCQLFIKLDMTWSQFKQYARSYAFDNTCKAIPNQKIHGFNDRVKETKKEQFYHIYTEDITDVDLDEISTEYERRYQPIKVIHNRKYYQQQQQLQQLQAKGQKEQTPLSELEKLAQVHRQETIGGTQDDEGRLFYECSECSCLVQDTDVQTVSLHSIYKSLNLLVVFRSYIGSELTFSPLQIFWDLRIDV